MTVTRVFLTTLAITLLSSCGSKTAPISQIKDVGKVEGTAAVVLHFNQEASTYEVWQCPELKAVRSFSECEAGGKVINKYKADEFFNTLITILKDNSDDITFDRHRNYVEKAADAILNDELEFIQAEQARYKAELEQIQEFIDFYGSQLTPEALAERQKRRLELEAINHRLTEFKIEYQQLTKLVEDFIALVVSQEALYYQEVSSVQMYTLLLSKLIAGYSPVIEARVGEPDQFGMTFAHIPVGTFMMGSPSSEDGRWDDEGPQHRVTISQAFQMGVTEVTRGQWYKVMGSYPDGNGCTPTVKQDDHPVSCVSWNDTQEFINKLNKLDTSYKYSLPTEAQWEYAARAGTTGKYSVDGPLENFAWYDDNSEGQTHPVAQLKANGFGLYDMHGNVWEWTADWYDKNYYSDSPSTDPKGPSTGSYRVYRGGSWYGLARGVRSADRSLYHPADRGTNVGLRLLRQPQ